MTIFLKLTAFLTCLRDGGMDLGFDYTTTSKMLYFMSNLACGYLSLTLRAPVSIVW